MDATHSSIAHSATPVHHPTPHAGAAHLAPPAAHAPIHTDTAVACGGGAAHDPGPLVHAPAEHPQPVHEGAVDSAALPIRPSIGTLALQSAGRAAIVGGALAALRHASEAAQGKKTTAQAAQDTAIDTAARAATGAAVGALGSVARTALGGVGLGVLARTAAPVAIGMVALDIGRDAVALTRKKLEPQRFHQKIVIHVFRGGTTWAGLEAGAALGTLAFPGVGTTLGAILGGILGYRAGTWLADE